MKRGIDESMLDADLLELLSNSRQLTQEDLDHLGRTNEALDDDPEFRADYLKSLFVNDILQAIEEGNQSQSELARRWGKSRQYLSRILNEDRRVNFTIETMAELAALVGRRLDLLVLNPSEHVHVLRCKVPERTVRPVTAESTETRHNRFIDFHSKEHQWLSSDSENRAS